MQLGHFLCSCESGRMRGVSPQAMIRRCPRPAKYRLYLILCAVPAFYFCSFQESRTKQFVGLTPAPEDATIVAFDSTTEVPTTAGHASLSACGWYMDYVQLHKREVEKLRRGSREVRVLVVECEGSKYLCGGLGDRLGGLASMFYTAVVLQRALIIHHVKPLPLRTTLFPNGDINWDIADLLPDDLSSEHLNLVDKFDLNKIDAVFDQNRSHAPIIRVSINRFYAGIALWSKLRCTRRWYIGAMFQMHADSCPGVKLSTNSDTFALAFNKLFKPSDRVSRRLVEMERAFFPGSKRPDAYVAMHARIGGNTRPSKFVAGWEDPKRDKLGDRFEFLNCAYNQGFPAAGLPPEHTPLLIFSDSQDFKNVMARTDSRVRYLNDSTLFHVDRSRGTDDMIIRGNVDAVAEFIMLSRASCIIASYSTFSGAASSLLKFRKGSACYFPVKDCGKDGIDFWSATEKPIEFNRDCSSMDDQESSHPSGIAE